MKTLTTLLVGVVIGAGGMVAIAEGQYDLMAVRRWGNIAVATGRGNLVYRNADGSTRVSNYYSFNVFEQRAGRWIYSAAFLP